MDGWPPTHFLRLNFKFNAIQFQFLSLFVLFIWTFFYLVYIYLYFDHRTETKKGRNTKKDRQGGKIQTKHAHQYIVHLNIMSIVWPWSRFILDVLFHSPSFISITKYSKSWSIPMQLRKYLCLLTACSVTACCLWLQWFTLQGKFRIDLISFCSTIDFRRQSIAPDAAILS